jgi:hypothetical protein
MLRKTRLLSISQSLADLARNLPAMLADATKRQRNVIIRPHGPGMMFLQLDDLDAEKLACAAPRASLPSKPRPAIFRRGWRSPAARTTAACAKAPEPIWVETRHSTIGITGRLPKLVSYEKTRDRM